MSERLEGTGRYWNDRGVGETLGDDGHLVAVHRADVAGQALRVGERVSYLESGARFGRATSGACRPEPTSDTAGEACPHCGGTGRVPAAPVGMT